MSAQKPKAFIGSSTEAKDLARLVARVLSDYCTPVLWWNAKAFEPSKCTLQGLLNALNEYDFGIFILTPDDRVTSRGKTKEAARDNVILELGMFLGALGEDRVFALAKLPEKKQKKLKLTSDLYGITIPRISGKDTEEVTASLENVLIPIREKIEDEGKRRIRICEIWGFGQSEKIFFVEVSPDLMNRYKKIILGNKLKVVARIFDSAMDFEDDTEIMLSRSRRIRRLAKKPFRIQIENTKIGKACRNGQLIEACLILVPKSVKIRGTTTIVKMENLGCRCLDRFAIQSA